MKQPDHEPDPSKEAPDTEPSRSEFRQMLEDYANDLREIIKRLRRLLN